MEGQREASASALCDYQTSPDLDRQLCDYNNPRQCSGGTHPAGLVDSDRLWGTRPKSGNDRIVDVRVRVHERYFSNRVLSTRRETLWLAACLLSQRGRVRRDVPHVPARESGHAQCCRRIKNGRMGPRRAAVTFVDCLQNGIQ